MSVALITRDEDNGKQHPPSFNNLKAKHSMLFPPLLGISRDIDEIKKCPSILLLCECGFILWHLMPTDSVSGAIYEMVAFILSILLTSIIKQNF